MDCARQSKKSAGETLLGRASSGRAAVVVDTITSASGSGYGSGRQKTACIALKMTVVPPIPIASVRTEASVNPGRRASTRIAWRVSRPVSRSVMVCPRSQRACCNAAVSRRASHQRPSGRLAATAIRVK